MASVLQKKIASPVQRTVANALRIVAMALVASMKTVRTAPATAAYVRSQTDVFPSTRLAAADVPVKSVSVIRIISAVTPNGTASV